MEGRCHGVKFSSKGTSVFPQKGGETGSTGKGVQKGVEMGRELIRKGKEYFFGVNGNGGGRTLGEREEKTAKKGRRCRSSQGGSTATQ